MANDICLDLENLNKYKAFFIKSNIDNSNYSDVELFLFKGLIRASKEEYLSFVLIGTKTESISIRVIIYALFDFYNKFESNTIDLSAFTFFIIGNKKYTQYLPLIYYSNELRFETNIEKLNTEDLSLEDIEKIKESHKNVNNTYDEIIIFNIENFKRGKFSPRYYRISTTAMHQSLIYLNNFLFNIFDVERKTNINISNLKELKKDLQHTRKIKLNRNFFKMKEMFETQNILL